MLHLMKGYSSEYYYIYNDIGTHTHGYWAADVDYAINDLENISAWDYDVPASSLGAFLEMYPDSEVVCSFKTVEELETNHPEWFI